MNAEGTAQLHGSFGMISLYIYRDVTLIPPHFNMSRL